MVYRILGYTLFSLLVVAFVLSFVGVQEIYLGNGFNNWLRFVDSKFSAWKLVIPDIPNVKFLAAKGETSSAEVPIDMNADGKVTLGEFFGWLDSKQSAPVKILNTIIYFFNFIINFLNLVIRIINIIVSMIQFVLTMVYCVGKLPEYLQADEWSHWGEENTIWWWRTIGSARTIV